MIENDFTYEGLRCVVIFQEEAGFRCGYVCVPETHPLFGVEYSAETPVLNGDSPVECFTVHGGLTFSQQVDADWWFGFDCGHFDLGDAPDYSLATDSNYREIMENIFMLFHKNGICKPQDYVEDECKGLAAQLALIRNPLP